MKYRKTIVFFTVLLMVFFLNILADTKEIKHIGRAPLMKISAGGISSVEQLKILVEKYADRIKEGFEKALVPDLYLPFMEQIKNATIAERVIPKNQEMMWMLSYSSLKKEVIAYVPVIWVGNATLDAFEFTVDTPCALYHFVIPKKCGNVSLLNSELKAVICDLKVTPPTVGLNETITVDVSGSTCASKVQVNVIFEGQQVDTHEFSAGNWVWTPSYAKPGKYIFEAKATNEKGVSSVNDCKAEVTVINANPICDLKVTPESNYVGKPFKVDASGSTDKDGKVVKADITVTDKKGIQVDSVSLTTEPMIWNKSFKKAGTYNFDLKVTDDFGAVSGNDCSAQVLVKKAWFWLVEAGPGVAKGTYSTVVFGRLGLAYFFIPDKLSFIVSAGAGFTLAGKPFKHHFLSNILLNYHAGSFFLGGGIGFSSTVREPDWKGGLDVVGNIGFDLCKTVDTRCSLFGEIRVPVRNELTFKHAHEFLVGFRYLF